MELFKQGDNLFIESRSYQFYYFAVEPAWGKIVWNNDRHLKVYLVPQVNVANQRDVLPKVVSSELRQDDSSLLLHLKVRSACWEHKDVFWRLSEEGIEHYCEVEGPCTYRIDDVLLIGMDSEGESSFSQGNFTKVFSPALNRSFHHYYKPTEVAHNPINAADYRGGMGIFTPSPHFFALQWPENAALGLGLLCKKDQNKFSDFSYCGNNEGFMLRLAYDRGTESCRKWSSPRIHFQDGTNEFSLLKDYCSLLYSRGYAARSSRTKPRWWYGPIFCGWGEQCSQAMRLRTDPDDAEANTRLAREASNQANYEKWLRTLCDKDIKPGIVIIDDAWAERPGSPVPHRDRWPDLRGFVDNCHDQGIRVLLWWNCFESSYAPPEECILNVKNQPVIGHYKAPCADPTNPEFKQRFRNIMRAVLSHDPGGLNADGLKVDINGGIPVERGILIKGNVWGVELMKAMMDLIYHSALEVKPDALVESHTASPYFNDSIDMLRLNDMVFPSGDLVIDGMRVRQKIARAASPDWLIDTDCWPLGDLNVFKDYTRIQPELGVPALYFAESIGAEPTPFTDVEYDCIRKTWDSYRGGIQKDIP